ncbi:hypothetical protein ACH5RR_023311, partial [Cinchona calisaya]
TEEYIGLKFDPNRSLDLRRARPPTVSLVHQTVHGTNGCICIFCRVLEFFGFYRFLLKIHKGLLQDIITSMQIIAKSFVLPDDKEGAKTKANKIDTSLK